MRLSHPWHTSWHMSRVTRDGGDHWCPRSVSSNPSPGQIYATVYNEQLVTGNIHTDRDGASTVPTIKYNPVTWNLIVDTYTGSCLLISICFTAVTLFYFIYLQIFLVWHIPSVWYKVVQSAAARGNISSSADRLITCRFRFR